MVEQIKHIRTSKLGKKFMAGGAYFKFNREPIAILNANDPRLNWKYKNKNKVLFDGKLYYHPFTSATFSIEQTRLQEFEYQRRMNYNNIDWIIIKKNNKENALKFGFVDTPVYAVYRSDEQVRKRQEMRYKK